MLALRKEVLLARSALQRLTLARDVQALREGLRWPRAAAAIASSPASRSLLLGALVLLAGRGRIARLLRNVGLALGVARLGVALFAHSRASQPPTAAEPPAS